MTSLFTGPLFTGILVKWSLKRIVQGLKTRTSVLNAGHGPPKAVSLRIRLERIINIPIFLRVDNSEILYLISLNNDKYRHIR